LANSAASPDAQFNYVTMLLHGDGTNGAQNNTFLDSSTNNFTITRNGNTTQGSFSPYGSNWSNYFSGASGNYLSTSASNSAFDFSSTKTMTFECWFNASTIEPNNNLFGINECEPFRFKITTSALVWEATSSGTTILSASQTWVKGTWYHVACVRSNDTLYMFINGTQVATTSYSTSWGTTGTGYPVSIAANRTDTWFFNGYISNLRLVKGTAVYTSSFTPSTAPLTAISGTSLLTCQSNRFVDNSGNNIALTVNGTPSVQRFNPFGASTAYSTSVIGGSGYFDGSGDYLSVPDNAALEGFSDFTIEGWVYVSDFTSGDTIAAKGWTPGGYAPWMLYFTSTDLTFYASSTLSSWNIASGDVIISNIQKNAWYHFAVSRSGSSLRLFSNGVLTTTVSNSTALGTNSGALTIGASLSGDRDPTMYLSDFRINTTALYTAAFTPPSAPLTAVTNTSLLTNFTNGAIFDNAMMNDLETVGNAQISTSVVKYGTGSLAFDGTGDYLIPPSGQNVTFGTGNFTIEGWFYWNSLASESAIMWGNGVGWTFYIYPANKLQWGTTTPQAAANLLTGSTTLATGQWYHIAVTRSSNTLTLWVNGVSDGTVTDSNNYSASGRLALGISHSNEYFNGYMDDVRITKGYARYTTNFTPPTAAFPNTGPI
jgi:hypothetical protein